MGFDKNLLAWFKSYFEDRSQLVHINGVYSKKFKATSGILQGSKLGPLLFAIFIDGIVSEAEYSLISLFADDCRISRVISNLQDAYGMQRDLDKVSRWISINKLEVNLKKCMKISFSRSNFVLDTDYSIEGRKISNAKIVRDLGVILDERWTFSDHLGYLLPKSFKRVSSKGSHSGSLQYQL